MTVRAFVFPGQGSQEVGMGATLAESHATARYVFEEVDDALGLKLSKIMFEGPQDELTLTENAQPALMAMSVAVVRVLQDEGELNLRDTCAFVAGHSLGEYSALAAAGALDIAPCARLLKTRGQAMQRAVPVGEGAMAALLGIELEAAEQLAEEVSGAGVCQVGNDNAPGQVVLSGATPAVERAAELASERGARRAIMLPVSAPFHCELMAPAAKVMAEALADATIKQPAVPLIANVTAESVTDPGEIRELLVKQVTGRVRWRESVFHMKQSGVEMLVEMGPGKVLTGLTKRIDGDLRSMAVGSPDDIEAFAATL